MFWLLSIFIAIMFSIIAETTMQLLTIL